MELQAESIWSNLLLVASLLIGVVVAVETIVIVSLLTLPLLGALARRLPWRHAADQRAEALLREVLPREEFSSLCRRGYLEVRSPSRPDRSYHIPRTRGTIDVYEQGRYHSTLCIAPIIALPDDDVVLAHKLMILGEEARYLETANLVRGVPWEQPASGMKPPRASSQRAMMVWALIALVATSLVAIGLHLTDQTAARDAVLMIVVGWPVVIALVSLLAGIAVLLMSVVIRPRHSSRRYDGPRRGLA